MLAVLFGHANLLRPIYGVVIYLRDVPVTGFFVLSGFLITLLLLRAHDKHGGISLKLFYTGRALRI